MHQMYRATFVKRAVIPGDDMYVVFCYYIVRMAWVRWHWGGSQGRPC
jgi:hypothetical protein